MRRESRRLESLLSKHSSISSVQLLHKEEGLRTDVQSDHRDAANPDASLSCNIAQKVICTHSDRTEAWFWRALDWLGFAILKI